MTTTGDDAMKTGSDSFSAEGPLNTQIGGAHYLGMPIQPVEFICRNDLGFIEGNVVKYICRHKKKGGAADIRKVIHYCRLLLELGYGEKE